MITSGFDRWARTYDGSPLQPAYQAAHDAVLGLARRLAGCPRRVLDVGCGTGRLLGTAAGLFPGAVLVGVDPSLGMLTMGAATGRVWRVQAAVEALPFRDGTFDLVVSTASLRHWTDRDAAMREIGRVLAPGGLFGLADLARDRRRDAAAPIEAAIAAGRLRRLRIDTVDGFGPIPAITVVFAESVAPDYIPRS